MNGTKENIAYLGLGSNVGDRYLNLRSAIKLLNSSFDCQIEEVSSVYETKPFGITDQENFFNAVVKIKTVLDHFGLFAKVKEIEKIIGRKVRRTWGPREIDIDILFFNDLIFSNEIITLPHKGVINRDFVIVPLIEIEPDFIHPVFNKKLKEYLEYLDEKYILRKTSYNLKLQQTIYDE